MEKPKLFYSAETNQYTLVPEPEDLLHCLNCQRLLEVGEHFFIHKSYSRRFFVRELYCMECIKEHRKRVYDEFITAWLGTEIPENSKFVPDLPPFLKSGSISVFDTAISNEGIQADTSGTLIKDHTRLAGKESWGGAQISMSEGELPPDKLLQGPESAKKYLMGFEIVEKTPPPQPKIEVMKENDKG